MSGERNDRLFRKVALEQAATTDRLDYMIEVTSVPAWMALGAMMSLLLAVLVWGLFGHLPSRVAGEGILIRAGGVKSVVAVVSGQVTSVRVGPGDRVEKGDVVATLAQPELEEQLDKARAQLAEIKSQDKERSALDSDSKRAQQAALAGDRAAARASLSASRQRLGWLRQAEQSVEGSVKAGLAARAELIQARRDVQDAQDAIARDLALLKQLELRETDLRTASGQDDLSTSLKLSERIRAIESLEEKLELSSKVMSPHAGRVIEVRAQDGSLVAPGNPILNLEFSDTSSTAKLVQAIVYLPPADGKKVKAGMEVALSPSTVRREEYGYLRGKVARVSDFPSTRQGMSRLLGNDDLVQRFMSFAQGAPIAVEVELISDPSTVSGLAWSSGRGPPLRVDSGTLATALITLQMQRPIDLVIGRPLFD